jgi:preprotein translocase subunit SecE
MAMLNPAQYVREVIGEVKKVTWPTRKETTVTTIMVFIMVTFAAIFFFLVDMALSTGVKYILGLGS